VNFPRAIELQADWAVDLLEHMRSVGLCRFQATQEAQSEWFARDRDEPADAAADGQEMVHRL
jgi:hypothetical protein